MSENPTPAAADPVADAAHLRRVTEAHTSKRRLEKLGRKNPRVRELVEKVSAGEQAAADLATAKVSLAAACAQCNHLEGKVGELSALDLSRSNVLGRIAIALFADANNVTDEACVTGVQSLRAETDSLRRQRDESRAECGKLQMEATATNKALADSQAEAVELRKQLAGVLSKPAAGGARKAGGTLPAAGEANPPANG